jgi:hypothetical protein
MLLKYRSVALAVAGFVALITSVALLTVAAATPARATIVTVTYTGVVSHGIDPIHVFGVGDNLDGQAYRAVYVFDTTVGGDIFSSPTFNYVLGGTLNGSPSPALSASMTINNVTAEFTPNFQGFDEGIRDVGSLIFQDVKRVASVGNFSEFGILIHRLDRLDAVLPASLTDPFSHTVNSQDGIFAFFQLEYKNLLNGQFSAFVKADLLPQTVTIGSPVPEPSTWATMILGFAGVGFMVYRRRKRAVFTA